ncbi:MAG TPA: nicotinate (nicotinamide) nucleotide adenylyltransferase [Acidobacteriaceae bacterium]|nr:nicotinate (nicotinamide) nucleotide adenylyltransferase [Acidobacteriaceae bacterium]
MRIAFFGGTFDPPHFGHIAIARAAISRLALDRVLVAPVGTQPLKSGSEHSSFEDRLAMVRLAVEGEPELIASDVDGPLPDGRPNYTVDTLQRLRSELQPSDALFFLLGADSFLTLKQWHRCADLLLFCDFIVAGRPGFLLEQINAALPGGVVSTREQRQDGYTRFTLSGSSGQSSALFLLPDLDQPISATEIRAALAGGAEQQTVLAPAVAEYIRTHGLYRYHRD